MPLHIDYRPKTLSEVAGNRETIEALRSVLGREKDVPHVFLFTGPSGCGKTTLGRIVATELGCSSADYKEIDSAVFRSIDDVRDMRNQTRLKPMGGGKCRVWLLDEVHMLGKGGDSSSNEAQNALLKILEDTPPHVYIILCTTNPEKLIKTIKSRCMQFTVSILSEREMTRLLKGIVSKEGVKDFPDEAYELIHQNSLGHVRAALQILDKIIDLPKESILKTIEKSVGEEAEVIDLCRLLLKRVSWSKVAPVLKSIQEKQEAESVRHAILAYMNSVLLKEDNGQAFIAIDAFSESFFQSGKPGLTKACYEAIKL